MLGDEAVIQLERTYTHTHASTPSHHHTTTPSYTDTSSHRLTKLKRERENAHMPLHTFDSHFFCSLSLSLLSLRIFADFCCLAPNGIVVVVVLVFSSPSSIMTRNEKKTLQKEGEDVGVRLDQTRLLSLTHTHAERQTKN